MSAYNWNEDPRPVCVIPDGGFESLKDIGDCKISQDYVGTLITYSQKIYDKNGKELDGDNETKVNIKYKKKLEHKMEVKKIQKIEQPVINTISVVEVPTKPLDIPPPPKKAYVFSASPVLIGAFLGMIGGMVGPMITNFLKSQAKKISKKQKKTEDKSLDCKTHNAQCNNRSTQFSANIQTLETRIGNIESKTSSDFPFGSNSIEDLVERIEKLEKKAKNR